MSVWLLDANILVSMTLPDHIHYGRVHRWLADVSNAKDSIATCSVTEGSLLRMHMQFGFEKSAQAAWSALSNIRSHPRHVFWAGDFSYTEINPSRLTGHKQLTDAWLVELARRKGGRLATMDIALSVLWPDVAFLIPV